MNIACKLCWEAFQGTYFCCVSLWGIQSSNFGKEMGNRIMKYLHWTCTAKGTHKVKKSFCLFGKGCHLFWQISLLLLHYMVHAVTQNTSIEWRKNMVQLLPVVTVLCVVEPKSHCNCRSLTSAALNCSWSLAEMNKKKGFFAKWITFG